MIFTAFGNLLDIVDFLAANADNVLDLNYSVFQVCTAKILCSNPLKNTSFHPQKSPCPFSNILCVMATKISIRALQDLICQIYRLDGTVTQITPLKQMQCLELLVHLDPQLFKQLHVPGLDIAVLPNNHYRLHKRLVVFDMDSTLIMQEVIDELAREYNVFHLIAPITEAAMRGELDFDQSLQQRVSLLTGAPASILESIKSKIVFTPGALELCRILSRLGYKLAVVSGGFLPLAEHVKSHLGLDYAFANNLEITNNVLTGRINGSIVNAAKKADILKMIAQQNNIAREEIIAVGDGANDLLMMQAASLGIAFNAKPKVQELADARINQPSLLNVLHLLGMNEQTIEFLQQGLL